VNEDGEGGGRPIDGSARVRHLYLHIPFCRARCAYCDFASTSLPLPEASGLAERYVEALKGECEARLPWGERGLETVYVGGGTPTHLPLPLLVRVLEQVAIRLQPGGEFTVEANPGTIDAAVLEAMSGVGVNRVSLGVQSFDPRLRSNLGRSVEQAEIDHAMGNLRQTGFENWNLDVVFGIPGARAVDIRRDLERAVEACPAHISLYDLTYTSAYTAYLAAKLGSKAAERAARRASRRAARLYEGAVTFLEERGYRRYEISNFSRPGRECRHNLAYWRGEDYLGVGAGAVSTIGLRRFRNPVGVEAYVAGGEAECEPLSRRIRLVEKAMLGLRTTMGVREEEVREVLDPAGLSAMLAAGVVERRYGTLVLDRRGMNVSNSVLTALLRVEEESS
jgi:oxygen-independent coproporphyrinogen-3 oxidase